MVKRTCIICGRPYETPVICDANFNQVYAVTCGCPECLLEAQNRGMIRTAVLEG